MTATEMSLAFDRFYDNIMSNQAPGLNEYEKSCFLTDAQDALVLELYSGSNRYPGFEGSELMRAALAPLVKTATVTGDVIVGKEITSKSYVYVLPDDCWCKVAEMATLSDADLYCNGSHTRSVMVIPTTHDTFMLTMDNPFRGPNERRVLRLDVSENMVELISKYDVASYTVRYLSRPSPIITVDLGEEDEDGAYSGLTVNGEYKQSDCILPDMLHNNIVQQAAMLAKSVWAANGVEETE